MGKEARGVWANMGSGGIKGGVPQVSKSAGGSKPKSKPTSGYEPHVDYTEMGPIQGGAFQADETDNAFRERDPESLFLGDTTSVIDPMTLIGVGA
jgi:hypothetical protein